MSRQSDRNGQPPDEPGFRPAPGGYVFREPTLWPFGAANHYIVTVVQKAEIADMLRRRRLFGLSFFALFVVLLVAQVLTVSRWAFVAACCALAAGAIGVYASERRRLRIFLSAVPRTDETITAGQVFQATAATTRFGTLLIWNALCAWWLFHSIMRIAASAAPFTFTSENLLKWTDVTLFASGLFYFGSLTVVKFMSQRRVN
jgi:hypothetical protein